MHLLNVKKQFTVKHNHKRKYCSRKCSVKANRETVIANLLKHNKEKKVSIIINNESINFESINKASDYLKIKASSLSNILSGRYTTSRFKDEYL